ncbi:MAG: hypothetical protein Q8L68_00320, partial [Methylococcales bacterium]|nr:hypothetical protein [Methylococcales bacterium]
TGISRMYADILKYNTLKESGNESSYPLTQLLKDMAWDIPIGATKTLSGMAGPLYQIAYGLIAKKDLRTGKAIVPPAAQTFGRGYKNFHYWGPWIFGQLVSPIANLIDAASIAAQSGKTIKASEFTMQVTALDVLMSKLSDMSGLDLNLPPVVRRIVYPIDPTRMLGAYAINITKGEGVAANEIIRNAQEDYARISFMFENKMIQMITTKFNDAQKQGIVELWIDNSLKPKIEGQIKIMTGEKISMGYVPEIKTFVQDSIIADPSVQNKIIQFAEEYGVTPAEVINALMETSMDPAGLIAVLDQLMVTSKMPLASWAETKKRAYQRDSVGSASNIPEVIKSKVIQDLDKLKQSQEGKGK